MMLATELYEPLRLAIALLCLLLALKIRHAPMCLYLLANAVEHFFPPLLYNAAWWRFGSFPVRLIQLSLALSVTLDLIRRIDMGTRDKWRLVAFAQFVGLEVALLPWVADLPDWFHSADTLRQNIYLGMAVAWTLISLLHSDLDMPRPQWRIGFGWMLWLWLQFVGASTAKHGLLWRIVEWKGGSFWWHAVSDLSIAGQTAVACWWLLSAARLSFRSPRADLVAVADRR